MATASSFLARNSDWLTAIAIFVVALIVARLVDRIVGRHGKPVVAVMAGGELSQVTVTRLRLVRRLLSATIVLVGLALALAQLAELRPLAAGLLASSAVVGIVLGFAARQTIANAVAGILLAIAQPLRVGDLIEWEDVRGTVADLTLTYTLLDTGAGHRVIVPNERIASGPLHNLTIAGETAGITVAVGVAPEAAPTALALLRDEFPDATVRVARLSRDEAELTIGWQGPVRDEPAAAAAALERALTRLADGDTLHSTPDS